MAYLGIDLGTTNSVGIIIDSDGSRLDVIRIDGVDEVLPSAVCFLDGEIIVGSEAKSGAVIYPEETILSIKRRIGEETPIVIGEQSFLPEDISGIILTRIKEAAEEQSGEVFNEVVITHPAYFNDKQIVATKKAGEYAGFKVVHLLSEPLAAAIEYGYKQNYAQTLLVYDLGGGTFDACVLKVNMDVYGNETFQELSDVGDMHLGGDDFDQALVDYMIGQFEVMTNLTLDMFEPSIIERIRYKLKQEAEQLKIKLSSTNKATIKINPLVVHEGIPYNLVQEVTKDDFEGLIRGYIERTRDIVGTALERAGVEADDISKVILVGGSTLIPMVKRMVAGNIKEPYRATDPAKSVAMGAAIYNYLIHLPNASVSIEQITRQIIGTEAVVDTNTLKKKMIPIIPMGTKIPTSVTDEGFTTTKGQAVRVDVYQWEEEAVENKKYIGNVMLEGISQDNQLALTYSINEDNIFEVFVKDMKTGNTSSASFDRHKTMPTLPTTTTKEGVAGINIVFIIDTTGSMDIYIEGVKERAIEFSNILKASDLDYQLCLIGFGDLYEKEKPKVYKFTSDVTKFQKNVKRVPRTYGGDIPESALDALITASEHVGKSELNRDYKNVFILITDAPPHVPTYKGKSILDVKKLLDDMAITTYVVAHKDSKSRQAYEPIVGKDGNYYNMDEPFFDILDNIAMSIAELIRLE
ncbi:MAG: Hsp70 family protein [Vallitaleaceae bacterium]|jgi:molecular chaperone DnaK|nr:Hsp70 family protein [Vallitaleaceae bacterium]